MWANIYRLDPTGDVVSEDTVPLESYMTKGECDRAQREAQRGKTNPSRLRYYVCYADTVDPRGPKGR